MAAEIQTQQHSAQSMMLTAAAPANKFKAGNQKCAKCHKVLSGHFVRALGTTWHLECFVCIVRLNVLEVLDLQQLRHRQYFVFQMYADPLILGL